MFISTKNSYHQLIFSFKQIHPLSFNHICRRDFTSSPPTSRQHFFHESSNNQNSSSSSSSPQITEEQLLFRTPVTVSIDNNEEKSRIPRMNSTFSNRGSRFISLEKQKLKNSDEYSSDVKKVYRVLRKLHSRAPKLELALQELGIAVSSPLVCVLNRCGDAGNLGYRFYVWASKQPGYRPSYEVKSMIRILSNKMRQFSVVWALIEEMRKENPRLLTVDAFVVLMRRSSLARMAGSESNSSVR